MTGPERVAYLTDTYSTTGENLFARYPGFRVFFLSMFGNMIFQTYLVPAGAVVGGIAQFSFCPMGTMTQMICKIKAKESL